MTRKVEGALIKPRLFIVVVGVFLSILYFSQTIFLGNQDPFDPSSSEDQRSHLIKLPYDLLAAYKARHATRVARYDIGIFGNSHVREVSSDYFREKGRLFNFFLPASSMRQSTNLIEYLAQVDKLPRTVVIGIPNFDRLIARSARWPVAPRRWINIGIESLTIWNKPLIDEEQGIRLVVRHLREERNIFINYLSARRAIAQFFFAAGYFSPTVRANFTYARDGHFERKDQLKARAMPIAGEGKRGAKPLPGVIVYDLERIAKFSPQARIVIFEDPLDPESMLYFAKNKDSYTELSRQHFLTACKRLKLECHLAAVLNNDAQSAAWEDQEHPPGRLLNPYIQYILANPAPLR